MTLQAETKNKCELFHYTRSGDERVMRPWLCMLEPYRSTSTMETLKNLWRHQTPERRQIWSISLLLTLNRFHTFFWFSYCKVWTSAFRMGTMKYKLRKLTPLRFRKLLFILTYLTHFWPMFPFYTPWKHQGIKWKHWP